MRRIGLIGGMSPESTKEYYSILVELTHERSGEGADDPVIIIYSINHAATTAHLMAGRHREFVDILAHAIKMLHNAGAEVISLTANTPHIFFDQLLKASPVPLVSIVDATVDKVVSMGVRRVLLLGTRHTMESDMYPEALKAKGIRTYVPEEAERAVIEKAIREELSNGVFDSGTRDRFIEICRTHIKKDDVDSVILGCTEIPLLLKDGDLPVPLINTTRIHAEAIFKAALTGSE